MVSSSTETTAGSEAATAAVAAAFAEVPRLAAIDPGLARRGRYLTCDFEIGVGRLPIAVSVASGEIRAVERGPFLLRSLTFSLMAEPETWEAFLAPIPAPGFHDILALSKSGRLRIAGDLRPLMANLQFIKDVLALPRALGGVRVAARGRPA